MRRRRFASEQWRKVFREQQASGLSVAAFCRRAKVPPASFYTWRRKLREAVSFAEVKVAPEYAVERGGLEVRLPGGRCVVVRAGFDRRTLLELLAALEAEA